MTSLRQATRCQDSISMHLPRRVLSILGLLSLLTSAHGGWEPSRMAPPWCEQLLRAQRNASCSTPFTDIAASHTVPLNLDRDEYLVAVAKASTRLKAPPPVWARTGGSGITTLDSSANTALMLTWPLMTPSGGRTPSSSTSASAGAASSSSRIACIMRATLNIARACSYRSASPIPQRM